VERVRHEGALADGITVSQATDVATALLSHDVYETLVDRAHWNHDQYEQWLRETLARLLLVAP
jgi:hypothetical protein